jgi:hypothetical protein
MQKDTDPEREGVIVRTDKTYIVVWNGDDDLVVASGDMIDEVRALVQAIVILASLINY